VLAAGEPAGWIGELHPSVAEAWELPGGSAFEVDLAVLFAAAPGPPAYEDVTSYPAVHRDLALVVPEAVPAATVLAVLAASALADDVGVFDVYRGPQVGEDRKSLAIHISFRAPDRTLTDADVDREVAALTEQLGAIGGELRA
jgi:phenylalanyl-tRNA synthetase beta chain